MFFSFTQKPFLNEILQKKNIVNYWRTFSFQNKNSALTLLYMGTDFNNLAPLFNKKKSNIKK